MRGVAGDLPSLYESPLTCRRACGRGRPHRGTAKTEPAKFRLGYYSSGLPEPLAAKTSRVTTRPAVVLPDWRADVFVSDERGDRHPVRAVRDSDGA